jgi:hypothetical protein
MPDAPAGVFEPDVFGDAGGSDVVPGRVNSAFPEPPLSWGQVYAACV